MAKEAGPNPMIIRSMRSPSARSTAPKARAVEILG